MSDTDKSSPDKTNSEHRCPQCDTVAPVGSSQCLMCGAALFFAPSKEPKRSEPDQEPKGFLPMALSYGDKKTSGSEPSSKPLPEVTYSALTGKVKKQKGGFPIFNWLIGLVILGTIGIGVLILRSPTPAAIAEVTVTETAVSPTTTLTPSAPLSATETQLPQPTPTITLTPGPTDTPRAPRFHSLGSGETLTLLSIIYRVSVDSIALENNLSVESPIQAGQELIIPWPTATPPLESIVLEVNGVSQIADVTDCEIYIIQQDDTAFGIAQSRNIPIEAVIAVNRQTSDSIQLLQPGDALCLPKIIYSDTLPPTPGPSPTPGPTLPPAGPSLLFPVDNAVLDLGQGGVTLQWTAVKNLTDTEWYMVEASEQDVIDGLPYRGFTRDTSFNVPQSWQPQDLGSHLMRWRVSIVEVTSRRSDGGFVYTYGGRSSADSFFSWVKE